MTPAATSAEACTTCSSGTYASHYDPCACDQDGVVHGVDTGRGTCKDHGTSGGMVCYVTMQCESATESGGFPGTKYRSCDPVEDNLPTPGANGVTEGGNLCAECIAGTFSTVVGAVSAADCQQVRVGWGRSEREGKVSLTNFLVAVRSRQGERNSVGNECRRLHRVRQRDVRQRGHRR